MECFIAINTHKTSSKTENLMYCNLQTAWQQQKSCFSVWYRMHRIVIHRKQFIYCYYCTTVSYTTFMEHWNVKKYIYKKLCRLTEKKVRLSVIFGFGLTDGFLNRKPLTDKHYAVLNV